jgi:hypothetical protein
LRGAAVILPDLHGECAHAVILPDIAVPDGEDLAAERVVFVGRAERDERRPFPVLSLGQQSSP